MSELNWNPGDEVEIITSRYLLRSLRTTDIGESTPSWYGDEARREHIWSPDMPVTRFLRGLATASDNKKYFALLALPRDGGEAIGLSKGQVAPEGQGAVYVVTTLLGEKSREGLMSGYEMTAGAIWFALHHLPVSAVSMRIYEGNDVALSMVRHAGYELESSYEEKTPVGAKRVFDYRKTKEAWLAKNGQKFSHYIVRKAQS